MPKKVLAINNGSTSFRFQLMEFEPYKVLINGRIEKINSDQSLLKYETYLNKKVEEQIEISSINDALSIMENIITSDNNRILNNKDELDAIGFRVISGGEKYKESTSIDDNLIKFIKKSSILYPLHSKNVYDSIIHCSSFFENSEKIAVFDTTFHNTIPEENYLYAIPDYFYREYGIRKYGFHGISYSSVLKKYLEQTNNEKKDTNTIICHLGGGSSICSIKNGCSYDTTMEFSCNSGMIMADRSGSIDNSIIYYLIKSKKMNIDTLFSILNEKSGYKAISDCDDAKQIVERSLNGDKEAILLRKMVELDFKKYLFSMMANLKRVDSIIMTGGIGSKNKEQREMLLRNLEFYGIELDLDKNNKLFNEFGIISKDNSRIPVYVIPDDEEKEIGTECIKVLKKKR